jgi:hypothetical protein
MRPGFGFEGDLVTEAFDAALEVGDGAGLADLVEVGLAQVLVGNPLRQHVVGGDKNFVGNGKRRAHGASAPWMPSTRSSAARVGVRWVPGLADKSSRRGR